jgi:hypothetical protein
LLCLLLAAACGGGNNSDDAPHPLAGCDVPQAPVLGVIHLGARLDFVTRNPELRVWVGCADSPDAEEPEEWLEERHLTLDTLGPRRVFARSDDPACPVEPLFSALYDVRPAYPPAAGQPGSTAIAKDDSAILGWAAEAVEPASYGEGVDEEWRHPEKALGPASGTAADVVCLGEGGALTLRFDPPIADGGGPDLAVFENGLNDSFLELAFVEVSSDGETFVRFDSASLGEDPVPPFGGLDTGKIGGLAGKYRAGFGTPFDLDELANRPEVLDGRLDLESVSSVRVVDVRGDGQTSDSFGNPIHDPYPTTGSAGFDLEAVARMN